MQLTRFSDIGLRLLMYLAAEQRELPSITVAEVAKQFDIPRNHLVKVTGLLAKHGYVTASRGRAGGIRLAQAPECILIGETVRILEGKSEVIPCEALQCSLRQNCKLRGALDKALNAFYEMLDSYTLADIIQGQSTTQIIQLQASFLQGRAA